MVRERSIMIVMAKKPSLDERALRIMGALVRMPPKPHNQMKLGKPRGKSSKKSQVYNRRRRMIEAELTEPQ